MHAICWWDNKPVYLLSMGGSVSFERVARREKSGEQVEVPCPRALKRYQEFMGGVDVHDQLRLQRYSIQRALRFQRYYKSLFMGLMDIAIVNAFLVYNARLRLDEKAPLSHVKFLKQLHLQLVQLQASDISDVIARGAAADSSAEPCRVPSGHLPIQLDEWRSANNPEKKKRRQRVCKVCSLLKTHSTRPSETSWYCGKCKKRNTPVYLCIKPRHVINNELMTCFDVWHKAWQNGMALPRQAKKRRIRSRPGKEADSRPKKRNKKADDSDEEEASDEEDEDESDNDENGGSEEDGE